MFFILPLPCCLGNFPLIAGEAKTVAYLKLPPTRGVRGEEGAKWWTESITEARCLQGLNYPKNGVLDLKLLYLFDSKMIFPPLKKATHLGIEYKEVGGQATSLVPGSRAAAVSGIGQDWSKHVLCASGWSEDRACSTGKRVSRVGQVEDQML